MAINPNLTNPYLQFNLIDAKKIGENMASNTGVNTGMFDTPAQAVESISDTTKTTDINANADVIKDEYSSYIDNLNALQAPDKLDLSGYTDQLADLQTKLGDIGTQYQEPIDALLEQLAAGPGKYTDEAANYAAQTMGYKDAAEMQADLQGMKGKTIADMQGLTDEERALYSKQAGSNIASIEKQAKDQLESVYANTGSTTRYLAAADDVRGQIADTRLSYDIAIAQEDYTRKLNELNRNDDMMKFTISSGQATAANYLQQRQAGVVDALSGYLQKVALDVQNVMSQSELVQSQAGLAANQFSADLQQVVTAADLIYKSATLEMGVDQFALDTAEQEYNATIAPALDYLNAEYIQAQIDDLNKSSDLVEQQIGATETAADEALGASVFGSILTVIGSIVGVILTKKL